jgi:hypothetical protein
LAALGPRTSSSPSKTARPASLLPSDSPLHPPQVCAEWFSRCRDLLLRLSNAAGCPHHALHHASARLSDLRAQLRALVAANQAHTQQAEAARAADAAAADAARAGAAATKGSGRGRGRQGASRGAPPGGRSGGGGEGMAAAANAAASAMSNLSLQAGPASLGQQAGPQGPQGPAPGAPALSAAEQRAQHELAMQRLAPTVTDVLAGAAAALLALRDGEGLRGLREWAADAFGALWKHQAQQEGLEFEFETDDRAGGGGRLGWLSGLEAAAHGRLQEAAVALSCALARPGLAPAAQAVAFEALGACYAGLEDWAALSGAEVDAAACAAPLAAAARDAAAEAAAAAADAQQGPAGAPPPAAVRARAHAAAAAAARASTAAALIRRAQAALLGHWTYATVGAAAVGSSHNCRLGSQSTGAGAAGSSDGVIAACLAALQQRHAMAGGAAAPPAGLPSALQAAAAERTEALAEWCAAAGWVGSPALAPQLRRLASLQLLLQQAGGADGDAPTITAAAIQNLLGPPARADGSGGIGSASSGGVLGSGSWAELLGDDGSLAASRAPSVGLQDLSPLLALARAAAARPGPECAAWAPALRALQRAAALAACRGGCQGALERAVAAAEALAAAEQGNGPIQERLWVRAVGARLRLACAAAGLPGTAAGEGGLPSSPGGAGASATGPCQLLAEAVQEHLALLAGAWPHQPAAAAPAARRAAALGFMSLASLLRGGPAAFATGAPPDWRAAFDAGLGALARRGMLAGGAPGVPPLALTDATAPIGACCVAAAAAAPAAPGPWRAFGDLLYGLAWEQPADGEPACAQQREEGSGLQGDGAAPRAQRGDAAPSRPGPLLPRAAHALALAAEAYCRHLAAGAAAGRLPAAEDGLAPMLRVLRLILRHAAPLAAPLRAALGLAPTAAWQALAPQLLAAALGHREPATRDLAALLLRGLAAGAPRAVLYPCIAEMRAAQERGEQVRRGPRALEPRSGAPARAPGPVRS